MIGLFFISIIGVIYFLDPLNFYHKETLYKPYYFANHRFEIPGIVKHSSYDTIFIGTSMSHNFYKEEIDEKLHVNGLNATLSGSSTKEQNLIANLAIQKDTTKTIYWEINFDSLYGDVDRVETTYGDFPHHMYDSNLLNDYKYIFSYYSVMQLLKDIKANVEQQETHDDYDEIIKFGDDRPTYSDEKIRKTITKERAHNPLPESVSYENMKYNFDNNILKVVTENPQINFVFYYAPYPIFNYVGSYKSFDGKVEARLELKKYIYNELEQLENVAIYDFQDHSNITYNTNNYMDHTHYYSDVNSYMLDFMATREPVKDKEEYFNKIDILADEIINFDPDRIIY
jgi:hypothetical protein